MHPGKLPVFPLKTICFPGHRLPLRVFEDRYVRMLEDIADAPAFVISLISHGEEVGEATPFRVGTLVEFDDVRTQGDFHFIRPRGRHRVYLETFDRETKPYLTALAVPYSDEAEPSDAPARIDSLEAGILGMASGLGPEESRGIPDVLEAMRAELGREDYSLFLCGCLDLPPIYLQRLLESRSLAYRVENALNLLSQRK